MVGEEDENLVYNSPSEVSNYLKLPEFDKDRLKDDLENSENIELPISSNFDILSPEEGSITRYANIFDDLDNYDSDNEDFDNTFRESYSDAPFYNSNRSLAGDNHLANNYKNEYDENCDLLSEKSMTFSDRVLKERQRMIRKKLLSTINANRSNRTREMNKYSLRPHAIERSFSFVKEDMDVDLDNKIVERHKRIDNLLEGQKNLIRDINLSTKRPDKSKEKLLQLQQQNERLLSENQQNCETIRNLKIEIENAQSDLIVERKQNEQLLKDKLELQNKINLLSKENRSLLTSQEMMQNMHNNEVEDLNSKKVELTSKITDLQNDLDFFRDSLQESHKMNEILKAEMTSLIDLYKTDKLCLQKLKIENKQLMENNSIYKSQNYSLIEINDRLRKRTLFCNHTGELSTTNSSTVTNVSSGINFQSTPTVGSPTTSRSGFTSNSLQNVNGNGVNYLDRGPHTSYPDVTSLDHSLSVSNISTALHHLNSAVNTPNSSDSNLVSPNSNTIVSKSSSLVSNSCQLDLVINNIEDSSNSPLDILSSNYNSSSYNDISHTKDFDGTQTYEVSKIIRDDKIANPTTKWVADRVSRNSSLDALESLREKIRNITIESNVENVNINGSLKCFQSNVTINLIQNKLQLISQRLNETIV